MSPVLVALVYIASAAIVVPLTLSLFRDGFAWIDIAIVAAGSGLSSLVPVIGGPLSLLMMIGLMHWRIAADWVPDKTAAVVASRLACVPMLWWLAT